MDAKASTLIEWDLQTREVQGIARNKLDIAAAGAGSHKQVYLDRGWNGHIGVMWGYKAL